MKQPWYESQSNRNALARWLDDRDEFTNPIDVIRFFDTPWKFNDEWQEYQSEKAEAIQPAERQLATA